MGERPEGGGPDSQAPSLLFGRGFSERETGAREKPALSGAWATCGGGQEQAAVRRVGGSVGLSTRTFWIHLACD